MPTSITNLRVFVASPSDVKDERSILEQVVAELNKIPGNRLNIRYELVKWETDSFPGFGEDAQSVINEEIGDDYDVFIGILAKKFGTKTNRSESGTEEEFQRAYERAQIYPSSIRIMIYFNDYPVSPSELDLEEYKKINSFRGRIGQQGVYYWLYKKTEDFEKIIRMHLGSVMEDFSVGKWGSNSATTFTQKSQIDTSLPIEEEEGFFDHILNSVENFNSATESINRIGTLMKDLTSKTKENTAEIRDSPKPISANNAKTLVNKQAILWENFTQKVEAELPILSSNFRSGIDSYTKSAQLQQDFNNKDKKQVKAGLIVIQKYIPIIASAQENTQKFKDAVQETPRLTKELIQAKRRLISLLDKLIEEYESEKVLVIEAEKIFLDIIGKYGNDMPNSE